MTASHFYNHYRGETSLEFGKAFPKCNFCWSKASSGYSSRFTEIMDTEKKVKNTPFWYISLKYSQNLITGIFLPHVEMKCQTLALLLYVYIVMVKTQKTTIWKDMETMGTNERNTKMQPFRCLPKQMPIQNTTQKKFLQ